MKYYDAHTHSQRSIDAIRNVIYAWDTPSAEGYYTVGAHPLFYETTPDFYIKLLTMCREDMVVAVGECGMDKRSPIPLTEQIDVFNAHVQVSEDLKKPLVIHCVGYFNELVNIRREASSTQPWIVHGYRKNPILAQQLVKQGFYFSLGKEGIAREGLLSVIPLDRLFLETDEDTSVTIDEVYASAAGVLGMEIDALCAQIESNFNRVFLHK